MDEKFELSQPVESPAQKSMRESRALVYRMIDAARTLDKVTDAYHASPVDVRRYIDLDGARDVKEELVSRVVSMMDPRI